MPIYDQGYQRWNGELQRHPARWWPIVRQGVWQFLPQRKYLTLLGMAFLGPIFAGATLFTRLKGADILESVLGRGGFDAGPAFYWSMMSRQSLWVVLFTIMVGADLVSSDRRFKALQLYFSKPITPNDYIIGKLGVIATFQFLVLWVPTMLLWLFGMMIEPSAAYVGAIWYVPLAATLYCVIMVLVSGLMMLTASSIGQRTVYIAGAWFIFFGYGPFRGVAQIMKGLSDSEYWGLLSIESNVGMFGAWLFGGDLPHEFHPLVSLLWLLLVSAGCYVLLRRRIRPVEVVL